MGLDYCFVCFCFALVNLMTDKCLLPYYGGCDLTRKCMSHRFGVRCGGCLEGFIIDPDDSRGPCLRKLPFSIGCILNRYG